MIASTHQGRVSVVWVESQNAKAGKMVEVKCEEVGWES